MKKAVCLLLALLMLSGSFAVSEAEKNNLPETILSNMTLRDKVAQMMIASFRLWKEVPEATDSEQPAEEAPAEKITELNDEIREMIRRDRFGGILLFGENFESAEQTVRLTADMQETNRDGGGIPLILFVDQEGGSVSRIGYATIGVSNMALAATGDPENARIMASIHGEEIGLLGIRADFAPVMDVNNNPANPVIGIRSFSDDPETVSEFGRAYLAGLHDAGIIAALKHFPGHGNTDTDSHTGFPVIDSTYEELQANELIPFKAAIDAGADLVMTAHIQYPQIEKETLTSISTGEQVYLPATMSRTILTDILRGDLGFEGVIVSDALDMAAIKDNFSLEDTLKRTIGAGVDLLILPAVKDTDLFKLTEAYVDTAVALAESGEIDRARIDESVLRILKLKQKYGILDQTDFTATEEKIAAAQENVGSAAHRETEWEIAEKALTLVQNRNDAFPIHMEAGEKTLILFADSCASRAGAGELARKMLEDRQALPEGAEISVMKNTKDNETECIQAALEADHVILVHRVYAWACLDPATEDGFSSGTFDKVIEALHGKGKTAILVSCQLPYDAARFPDADAILLTYWGSAMRQLPGEGVSWSANLPAGLLACFGLCTAKGISPVKIPALDDAYKPMYYTHDPRKNPKAMRDIVVNPDAVYGFSPSPAEESTLKEYATMIDWTDPEKVAAGREQRQAYHDSLQELYEMITVMVNENQDIETIARAVSQRRNELRMEAYADDPEGLALAKQRNLETYGNEFGPTQDSLYEKYGSWNMVLYKALGTNAGMDACLGFYDDYYYLYDLEGSDLLP